MFRLVVHLFEVDGALGTPSRTSGRLPDLYLEEKIHMLYFGKYVPYKII